MQKLRTRNIDEIPDDEKSDEVVLLTEIRDLLGERRA
jgi:large-conductance mechanosensitive channel